MVDTPVTKQTDGGHVPPAAGRPSREAAGRETFVLPAMLPEIIDIQLVFVFESPMPTFSRTSFSPPMAMG